MKRRHFLQLAAGAVVVHSAPSALANASPSEPGELLAMLLEEKSDGSHQWILHGRSHPASDPLVLPCGRRYRLRLMNATGSSHSVRIPEHHFEMARVEQAPVSGMYRNSIRLDRYNVVEADVFLQRPQPLVID